MLTRLGGMAAVAALVSVIGLMSALAASASAATTTCNGHSGTIKLSPGLSESPHVQNITIKGTLSECSGEESTVTSSKYVAHLKTTDAVTCSALTGPSAAAEGSIVIKWSPKSGGNSLGSFSMPLTEVPGVAIGGTLESGPFSSASIAGTVSQAYTGAATCGKKRKVNKGSFTGSPVTVS